MNERIKELAKQAGFEITPWGNNLLPCVHQEGPVNVQLTKFAELIVKEMSGMMEQTEDDCYYWFDASERPFEYIEWLRHWQERFTKHFGVKE